MIILGRNVIPKMAEHFLAAGYLLYLLPYLISEPNCLTLDNCSPNGKCTPTEYEGEFECKCLPGYMGDGYYCREETPNTPKCIFGVCICSVGYIYHGISCREDPLPESEHPRAEPMCYGNSCTCPKGYKFNLLTKICDLDHIPIPAEGK